jgi:hypothetical protein
MSLPVTLQLPTTQLRAGAPVRHEETPQAAQASMQGALLMVHCGPLHVGTGARRKGNAAMGSEGKAARNSKRASTSLRGSGAGTADGAKSDDLEALLNEDGTLKEPQPEASGDYWDDEGWDTDVLIHMCTEGTRAFFQLEYNHVSLLVRCHKAVCRPAFARLTSDVTCS